jgi:N-acetylglucosamine kinase-like BadF-type ATPase
VSSGVPNVQFERLGRGRCGIPLAPAHRIGLETVHYFLGVDVGGTKTHALVSDESGRVVGFGLGGPGNHETVGYRGLVEALRASTGQALARAAIEVQQISGAGFGVAGYDWPSEREPTLGAIAELGLNAPVEAVNDAVVGLLAGAAEGWGVAVVSGTGCNCCGLDRSRRRIGRVTGYGQMMGEAAGGSELVARAQQAVAHAWTRRGPPTRLTDAFARHAGSRDADELVEGLTMGRIWLDASLALLVFEIAEQGDAVARDVIRWAGQELGELANAVIRQLEFEALEFDVVLVGGMYNGGPMLIEPMRATIQSLAPRARLMRLTAPPVVGAVLLGMEQASVDASRVREALLDSVGEAGMPTSS